MAVSTEVPGRLPVAIDGHPYLADPNIVRQTVPVIRQQADTSSEAGEQSLSPQGLWRRSQESWHHGAGQAFLDGRQSDEATDPHRFRSSKGVDVWTKGQVSLLRPTLKVWSSANDNLHLVTPQVTGSPGIFELYVSDGTEVYLNALPFGGLNTVALQTGVGWTTTNATLAAFGTTGSAFNITATAAAAVSATSPGGLSGMVVEPGRLYGVLVESSYISGGAGKLPRVNVTWYNAAGATISSTTPFTGTTDASVADVSTTVTAPVGAAFMSITISYSTNWALGEVHRITIANAAPSEDLAVFTGPGVWSSVSINAGQAAQTVQSLATNGSVVWAALGTSGLHRTSAGFTTSTADVPAAPAAGQISLVGYANGFLLAAGSATVTTGQNVLWVVNDPLGTPSLTIIKTHPNTDFVWTGISSGRSCVYAYGNAGGTGEVYKVTFDPNTGTLSAAASPASFLPDGETIHALTFYAGTIIIGTGRGVRIGTADGAGNIDYGPLTPTTWPVKCLEPQDRYCWFGWTKYDSSNSGLGRIDLGFLTGTLTPAWASDLMTSDTSSGDVVDCVTFAPYGYTANQRPPVRVFAVSGKGVYIEDPGSRVTDGWFFTGTIRFSTSEPKTARSLDVRHHRLPAGATVMAWAAFDGSPAYSLYGTSSTTNSFGPAAPFDLASPNVEALEMQIELTRPTPVGTDFTLSPELTRWTAKVLPTPSTIDETLQIPLVMRTEVLTDTGDGVPFHINVPAEIAYLKGLERTRQLITVQAGAETITNCYISASRFEADTWGPGRQWLEGKYTIEVSTARG